MKKMLLSCSVLAALGLGLQAQAGPVAGRFEILPAGSWSEFLQNGQPGQVGNEISASGPNYLFAGATLASVTNDATGEWDWITKYENGTLVLTNAPGAPWFAPCDNSPAFTVAFPEVWVKTRSTRFASTNEGYLEFVLKAGNQSYELKATYSGMPTYTSDTNGILASGDLRTARISLGKVVKVDVMPTPFNVASKGMLPVAIYSAPGFSARNVNPASVKLACVPASGWSYAADSGKLLLKFDRQAIVAKLPFVEDRETISLVLTGELKNGTAISGSDNVLILKKGKPVAAPKGKK
jgi:hypothetical protein